jgi:hypothetical protein
MRVTSAVVFVLLFAANPTAAGPPQCPSGFGPVWQGTWKCERGVHWPAAPDLEQSDCPPGTSFVQMYQEGACLPSPPHCPPGALPFASDTTVDTAAGWMCLQRPGCVTGTEALLDIQGWECYAPGNPVVDQCPMGSLWVGVCCGACAPADRKICEKLRGWKWVDGRCQLS